MGAFFYENNFVMGINSCINRKCHLDCRDQLTIGNSVSVSPDCTILTGSHDYNSPTFAFKSGPVTLNDYVWLGTRVMILPGVDVGKGAVVCAGAVVTKNVAPYTVVAGVPAKEIGKRSSDLNYSNEWFLPFD